MSPRKNPGAFLLAQKTAPEDAGFLRRLVVSGLLNEPFDAFVYEIENPPNTDHNGNTDNPPQHMLFPFRLLRIAPLVHDELHKSKEKVYHSKRKEKDDNRRQNCITDFLDDIHNKIRDLLETVRN